MTEPEAASEPVESVESVDEPLQPSPAQRAPTSAGCPFPAPAQSTDDDGSVAAAPVLGHETLAPRDMPPDARTAIVDALDPRFSKGRSAPRSRLETQARLIERLLKATPPADPDRPALIRRLAEVEAALAHAAQQDKNGPAEARYRRAAIGHYESFKTSYPGDKTLDQVLYHLALEHQRLGDQSAARKAYLELTTAVPRSKLVPHAYFAFGELFFQEASSDPTKFALAQRFYQEVLKHPSPSNPLVGLAHYRLGHVFWRQKDPTRALEAFVKTLQYVGAFPKAPEVSALGPAALDGAVHTYAEAGRPDRACLFLHRVAATPPSAAVTLGALTSLGEAYLRAGRRAEALVTYQILERYHEGPERRRDRAVLFMLRAK